MPLIGDLRQAARLYGEGSRRAPLSPNAPPLLVVAAYHPQSGKSQRALCSSNHNTYKLYLEEYKVAGRIQEKYYCSEYITHSHLNFTNALKPTTLVSRDQCHLGRPSRPSAWTASYAQLHRVSTLPDAAVARSYLYTASIKSLNDPFD
jgi:hypothetical protein